MYIGETFQMYAYLYMVERRAMHSKRRKLFVLHRLHITKILFTESQQ